MTRLAVELHKAAVVSGETVAAPAGLKAMIRAWLSGRHAPSPRYRYLLREVFPEARQVNGAAPASLAGLAADLERRAAALPGEAQVTAMEAAALARVPAERAAEIRAAARAAMADLEGFRAKLKLITEALDDGDGDE